MIDSHLTPELVISGLRLLVEGYKVAREKFKDKKAPDRVEEIVIKVEQSQQNTIELSEIERQITDALNASDAAIVKADFELLSLLLFPLPKLDAFDYWSMLTRLVDGLRAYAKEKRLFELRGMIKREFGLVLLLPKTGPCILPKKHAVDLPTPYQMQGLKEVESLAFLRKETDKFPIQVMVGAQFYEYQMTGGTPGVAMDSSFYDVWSGQQPHWLAFNNTNRYSAHFSPGLEYMLEASDFINICTALRNDIREYAAAIQTDQEKISPLSIAIDAFSKGIGL